MNSMQALLTLAVLTGAQCSQAGAPPTDVAAEDRRFAEARKQLAVSIRDYAAPIGEPANPRILRAIGELPRHLFVPASQRPLAYIDEALPIGEDQTISQPSLVALMTHLLRPRENDVMLEVGTGSGYQAALLSRLVRHVYTIEIVEPLAKESGRRLAALGYANVTVRQGDGYAGWPQHAPFDGIIVTAGAPHVPKPLLDQLKPGGRMVIPVGPAHSIQELKLIRKDARGGASEEVIRSRQIRPAHARGEVELTKAGLEPARQNASPSAPLPSVQNSPTLSGFEWRVRRLTATRRPAPQDGGESHA